MLLGLIVNKTQRCHVSACGEIHSFAKLFPVMHPAVEFQRTIIITNSCFSFYLIALVRIFE